MLKFWMATAMICCLTLPVTGQELPTPRQASDSGADENLTNQDIVAPESLNEKASFMIGYNFLINLQREQAEVDIKQLVNGIVTASQGKPTGMTDEEIQSVMLAFEKQLMERQRARWESMSAENKRQGEAFLKTNAEKEGVKVLENGAQISVLNNADGQPPRITDRVRFHFKESLIDGTVIQSTFGGEPEVFTVGTFPIRGVTHAMQRMAPGAKWRIVLPPELAYGPTGSSQGIGPNQVVIYEIELVEILK